MTTRLYTHTDCFAHDPGRMHPEHPARLKAVLTALEDETFTALERHDAPMAGLDRVELAHPHAHIEGILGAVPKEGMRQIDTDTCVSAGSREAALRAVGGICAAVDAVVTDQCDNAFCAVRPPGHHAERTRAMGFCLFNNVVIGALHAREAHRLHRIAVVDFDVHHGNGTQDLFWNDPDLWLASTHQMPLYPGTGRPEERGVNNNIVNVPLQPMQGGAEFRQAMSDVVLPQLAKFQPELVLISAGFDAHEKDPLASLRFHEDDYHWATAEIMKVARSACGANVVSVLEGGYEMESMSASAAAHVRALMGIA
jgi:acetoin utilization deacetylase AcuC-like enzyme